jgi:hypothetical protein
MTRQHEGGDCAASTEQYWWGWFGSGPSTQKPDIERGCLLDGLMGSLVI